MKSIEMLNFERTSPMVELLNDVMFRRLTANGVFADGGGQRRVRLPRAQRLQLALVADTDHSAR